MALTPAIQGPKNVLRLPEQLLNEVRTRAKNEGIPYQRYIRMAIERALQREK